MWLLVVMSCIAGDPVPQCGSGVSSTYYTLREDCTDAAVVYHDRLRLIAEADGEDILFVDTRCVSMDLWAGT